MVSARRGSAYIYIDIVSGRGGNGIRLDNLPDSFAGQLDSKLDDGSFFTSTVRVADPYNNSGTIITPTAICL